MNRAEAGKRSGLD